MQRSKKERKPQPIKPAAKEAPYRLGWTCETPYFFFSMNALAIEADQGEVGQNIELTREEFIELKIRLAQLRGLPCNLAKGTKLPEASNAA